MKKYTEKNCGKKQGCMNAATYQNVRKLYIIIGVYIVPISMIDICLI